MVYKNGEFSRDTYLKDMDSFQTSLNGSDFTRYEHSAGEWFMSKAQTMSDKRRILGQFDHSLHRVSLMHSGAWFALGIQKSEMIWSAALNLCSGTFWLGSQYMNFLHGIGHAIIYSTTQPFLSAPMLLDPCAPLRFGAQLAHEHRDKVLAQALRITKSGPDPFFNYVVTGGVFDSFFSVVITNLEQLSHDEAVMHCSTTTAAPLWCFMFSFEWLLFADNLDKDAPWRSHDWYRNLLVKCQSAPMTTQWHNLGCIAAFSAYYGKYLSPHDICAIFLSDGERRACFVGFVLFPAAFTCIDSLWQARSIAPLFNAINVTIATVQMCSVRTSLVEMSLAKNHNHPYHQSIMPFFYQV